MNGFLTISEGKMHRTGKIRQASQTQIESCSYRYGHQGQLMMIMIVIRKYVI